METDPKIRFDYLHKELVEYQLRFVELSFKSAGLIVLALGWLMTSSTAQSVIARNALGRSSVIIGLVIMVIAYVAMAVRMYRVMHRLAQQMDALEYLPQSYYHFRALPPQTMIGAAATIIVPAAITIAFVIFGAGS
jgi:uncharacterized membrane protein